MLHRDALVGGEDMPIVGQAVGRGTTLQHAASLTGSPDWYTHDIDAPRLRRSCG